MKQNLKISGFADEITQDLDEQLRVLTGLGMRYLCLRSAQGKGIADYSPEEIEQTLLPKLRAAGVGVSSLGSAIGKVSVEDQAGFAAQLKQMERLCQSCRLLGCRYIRVFSFYIPEGSDPAAYAEQVVEKLRRMVEVARRWDVVLLHENEKGIFGDTGARCRQLFDALGGPHFRAAFDFANFVQCGEDPEQCWQQLAGHIEYLHIKDAVMGSNENVVCGTGDGKIRPLLARAIVQEGYEGFLTLEPHLVRFDFFAPGKQAKGQKIQFENHKANSGAEAYALQYNALQNILREIPG